MAKRADIAPWLDRLVWRKTLELLHMHFRSRVSSGVLITLGFLAAALVSVEICSHASVPDHSGNFSPEEVFANTEMLLAPDAPTSVSVVRKLARSLSTPGSQADPVRPHNAMTNANAEASLFSGETVSSKMLMMGFSMASTAAAAAAPVSSLTPSAVTPRPKLKRQPTAQKPQAAEHPPQPKLSWWQRFPWLSLP
jgi:hypothetical protein